VSAATWTRRGGLCRGDQATAADLTDHPAADARVAAVVVARIDIEAKERALNNILRGFSKLTFTFEQ
jgi:hypothetical protein